MSILDVLGAGDVIAKPIDAIGNALGKVITTDKERLAAEQAMELLRQQPHILQVELDKLEAKSKSLFKSGWRPAIGWICAIAFCWNYVGQPFFTFWIIAFGIQLPVLPILEMNEMMPILLGMLGLGGMRSFDRYHGKIPPGK